MSNGMLYPCNREFDKTIKYNGHWYHLRSVFDDAFDDGRYDFNAPVNETTFGMEEDFSDYICRVNNVNDRAQLDKFMNALSIKPVSDGHILTICPTISVYAGGVEVAKINGNEEGDYATQFARFVKQANVYLNEIGLGVMGQVAKSSNATARPAVNPQLAALGMLSVQNDLDSGRFPDASVNIGNAEIPLDFKACLNDNCGVGGSSNKTMISNMLLAMVEVCEDSTTDNRAKAFMNKLCAEQPEFKGLLLFVSTSYDKQGNFTCDSFKIKPLLACLRIAYRSDHPLLSSKRGHSMGAVAFFRGGDETCFPLNNFGFPKVIADLMNNFCRIGDYGLYIDNRIVNDKYTMLFEKVEGDILIHVKIKDIDRTLSVHEFFNGGIVDKNV